MTTIQLVHEAETQRQQPRLRIPIHVELGGDEYEAWDFSVRGLGLPKDGPTLKRGQRIPMLLRLPFEDFDMSLSLMAEVRHEGGADRGAGLQFVDLTPRQINFLHHAINGYLSGEIVQAGDIFDVAARDYGTAPRPARAGSATRSRFFGFRRALGLTIVAVVGIACVAFVTMSVAERIFVTDATGAVSSDHAVILRSPMAGILRNVLIRPGQAVEPGTVVAMVESGDGATTAVRSPCECVLATSYTREGEYLNYNQAMIGMTPDAAAQIVIAQVPLDEARNIRPGDTAFVDFLDGRASILGRVGEVAAASIDPNSYAGRSFNTEPLARIEVVIEERLPISYMGQPVGVRISSMARALSDLAAKFRS